jgi:hypothetical protein
VGLRAITKLSQMRDICAERLVLGKQAIVQTERLACDRYRLSIEDILMRDASASGIFLKRISRHNQL